MDEENQKRLLQKGLLSQDYDKVDQLMIHDKSGENREEGDQEQGEDDKEHKPPSKEAALKHKGMWLFKDFERDGNGLPIGEGYPFHFFSGSRDIGLESEGLGLYFQSMVLFGLILIGLVILSIAPLVYNLQNVHFNSEYVFKQYEIEKINVLQKDCPRNFSSVGQYNLAGLAFYSSIGAYCPDNSYSNPFECPAICEWNISRARNEPECKNLDFDSFLNGSCNLHLPCSSKSRETAANDPRQISGICLCCDLELNPEKDGSTPIWQIYIYLFGIFLFLCGVEVLQGLSELYARQIDASQCTSADYSILVSELGFKDQISKEDLSEFVRHYGEVVHIARIKKVGEIVCKSRQLTQLYLKKYEIQTQINHPAKIHCGCGIFYWIFLKLYAGNKPKELEAINQKIQKVEAEVDELEKKDLKNTDSAIVIMNYRDHTENIIRDFRRTIYQKFKRNVTFGRLDDCPKLKGQSLVITRAPEPTDVWWQHNQYVGHLGRIRRIISAFVMVLVLIVSIAIQAYLWFLAANQRRQLMVERASGATNSSVEKIGFKNVFFVNSVMIELLKEALSFLTSYFTSFSNLYSIVVILLNVVVSQLISFLTYYEMWSTRSAHEKWYVLKLSFFYIINSAVVPALAPIVWDSINSSEEDLKATQTFYTSGGVINQALSIQLSNAVVADLLTLFNPWFILTKKILPRFAQTQEMLNLMMKPPDFPLAERFSSAMKTIGLALFFGPALPISYPIALFGIFFSYWTDKYVALRRCKKPQALNDEVDDTILFVLRLLPVMQILMMAFVYFEDTGIKQQIIILIVGFFIWGVFLFFEFGLLLRLRKKQEEHDHGGTRDQPYLETLGKQGQLINHDQDDVELSEAQSNAIVTNYHRRKQEKDVRIVLVRRFMYKPRVRRVTDEFAQILSDLYDVPNFALPPIQTLLQGQKADMGGLNALAPEPQHGNINFGSPDDSTPVHHNPNHQPHSFVSAVQKVKNSQSLFEKGRYPTFKRYAGEVHKDDDSPISPYLPMVLYKSGPQPQQDGKDKDSVGRSSANVLDGDDRDPEP